MTTPLNDLLTTLTPTESLDFELGLLSSGSFPTTNWSPASKIYNILKTWAVGYSDLTNTVKNIAQMGLLTLSSGSFLTLFAKDFFQEDRVLGQPAILSANVSIVSSSISQNINPAGLTIRTSTNLRYISNNTASVFIHSASYQNMHFHAEEIGTKYNSPSLNTPMFMVTAYPGMSVQLQNTGNGTPYIQQGTLDQKDVSLTEECQNKWGTIGLQKTDDAYEYLIKNTPDITTIPSKILILSNNPVGPQTINIYVYGDVQPISTDDVALINTYLQDRQAVCTTLTVNNATTTEVTTSATVYYYSAYTTVEADIEAAITEHFADIPIGGTIYLSDIIDIIEEVNGVRNSTNWKLNNVEGDLVLGSTNAASPLFSITLVAL